MTPAVARRKPATQPDKAPWPSSGRSAGPRPAVEHPAMAVDPELLEILACPNCKTKVDLVKNGTALKCAQCKRVYPIKDDIPVMLLDEAVVEP
jgi:hypothetical protein